MGILYLIKKNDDYISFCTCAESLVGNPGQLDCPWCGCGWLFSCTKCRKAFTFAEAAEIDKTWEEIATEDLHGYGGQEPTQAEIAEWIEFMQAMLSHIKLGKTYVYLDGMFIPADEENISAEGWHAKHEFERAPHILALNDPDIQHRILANPDYWHENEI